MKQFKQFFPEHFELGIKWLLIELIVQSLFPQSQSVIPVLIVIN